MVQHHRYLHRSFVGLLTGLASRGRIVIDSLVVNTKDVSGPIDNKQIFKIRKRGVRNLAKLPADAFSRFSGRNGRTDGTVTRRLLPILQ